MLGEDAWGLSETQAGGYTAYQRVKPDWLVRIPDRFTTRQAMAIGTAGYTAALCVEAIETWGVRDSGDVLVTGAAGGVGSVAIALLATRGLRVTASTRRPSTHDYLAKLGATGFVPREELAVSGAPLQKEKWGAAIDSVGGATLVNVLSQTIYGGAVAACGLAGGAEMPKATVLPHILRGIALLSIDSVMAARVKREQAWARLTRDLKLVPAEAETVRTIFARYLELGSMGALLAELDRQGIRTKVNVRRDGGRSGGICFGVGSLAHLLKNRFYLGEVQRPRLSGRY